MILLIPRQRLLASLIFVFCACLVTAVGVGRKSSAAGQSTEISRADTPLENLIPTNDASIKFLRGGNLHDLTLKSEMRLGREWSVLLQGQFERWRFPLLFSDSSANLTASAQLTWTPEWRSR